MDDVFAVNNGQYRDGLWICMEVLTDVRVSTECDIGRGMYLS